MAEYADLQELIINAMDFLGKDINGKLLNECILEQRTFRGENFIDLFYLQNINEESSAKVYFGCTRFKNDFLKYILKTKSNH